MPRPGKVLPLVQNGQVRETDSNSMTQLGAAVGTSRADASETSRNLMARDEFKNLGFAEPPPPPAPAKEPEKGVKGELRW